MSLWIILRFGMYHKMMILCFNICRNEQKLALKLYERKKEHSILLYYVNIKQDTINNMQF